MSEREREREKEKYHHEMTNRYDNLKIPHSSNLDDLGEVQIVEVRIHKTGEVRTVEVQILECKIAEF